MTPGPLHKDKHMGSYTILDGSVDWLCGSDPTSAFPRPTEGSKKQARKTPTQRCCIGVARGLLGGSICWTL